jgi:hypothetical protein
MKGLRTLLINGATVVGTAAVTWVAGVDWTQYVSPTSAVIIVAAANMALRLITTTPVGKSQ